MPAGEQPSLEPEVIAPGATRKLTAAALRMNSSAHHALVAKLEPVGIVLLAPAILALSAAIVLALLGIFVIWLVVVGLLVAEIVAADLVHWGIARTRPLGALGQGALPAGQ